MEANEAKKPKRPRIGQPVGLSDNTPHTTDNSNYENHSFNSGENRAASADGEHQSGYQQHDRPYQRQGGYQQRQGGYQQRNGGYNNRQGGYNNHYNNQGGYQRQGGYNRNNQGGYQQRYPQQRPENPDTVGETSTAATDTAATTDGDTTAATQQTGYQPRQNYQQRQGGYNNRYNQQGGYNNRQGGYNNRNNQGGYQQRNNYNNQGGQQGGYNNNRQGGYNNRNNQQGGYNRQGGYNNRNNQQGGYNRQGGYNNQGNRFQKGPVRQGKSFTPRPKRIEYELPLPDPDEKIRLNKFMANAGICSRREADEFIQQGLVKVNGEVVTELGTKISHDDTVEYGEKVVALESKCYILLNKPKDCVTTSDDPNGRTTVLDLVKGACNERIYPVGRLDRNTTGVLLLTNDGDLASKLTHPKYVKKKIYHVWTDKDIAEEDMQRIADGIELEDGPIHADAISYATETDRNQAGIEIHSGRNRIVRRIFESLGYHVTKLDRVYFAGLTKKNLPRGRWRYLTQEEVNFLKMGSFE